MVATPSTLSRTAARRPTARPGVPHVTSPDERADVVLLTGLDADALLTAVAAAEGVRLMAWRTHQVHHRPGVGVTVGWVVTWERDGLTGEDYLLGTTCPVPTGRQGSTTVQLGGREVVVWRHPADPVLPGLAAAMDPGRWLDAPPTALELVTYRPLRRAVLRVTTPERTAYLKVVRPATAELLAARHRLLGEAGLPVAPARLLPDGVLLLDALPGRPLTDAFAADGAVEVDPQVVPALLDRLPAVVTQLPRRASWTDRVRHHAAAAALVLPARSREIERLGRRLAGLAASSDAGPVVPSHGDLHQANLLMAGGQVVGLLDVDAAGPGHRVDDLACLLGHLSVLPALAPEVHRHVPAALPRWTAALEPDVDPVGLRARAGAVALSLVAGARREGDPSWRSDAHGRLAAAIAWCESAADLAGAADLVGTAHLRALSSGSPSPLTRGDDR